MLKSNLKRFLYKMIEIVFQNFPLYLLFNVCLISPSHYSRYVDFATFIITGFCISKIQVSKVILKLQTECYSTKIINLFFVGKYPTLENQQVKKCFLRFSWKLRRIQNWFQPIVNCHCCCHKDVSRFSMVRKHLGFELEEHIV